MHLTAGQAAFPWLRKNFGWAALRVLRNAVRHYDYPRIVPPHEVRLARPDGYLQPALLFPEIGQCVQQENNAQAIQQQENVHGQ